MQHLGAISKTPEWSLFISKANHSVSCLCSNHWCLRSWNWLVLWGPTRCSRMNTKNNVLFIIEDWNAKVESQEMSGMTGEFGLGVQNETGQRLMESCQENTLVAANTLFQQQRRLCTWASPDGQIRWTIFFAANHEKLYKTRSGLVQVISSLLQNSGLNWRK